MQWVPDAPDISRPDRESLRAAAAVLLGDWPPLRVGFSEDPDVAEGHVEIRLCDLAAHQFAFLVPRTLDVIAARPGVEAAWRDDRGLIMIEGEVDQFALRSRLEEWWETNFGPSDVVEGCA